MYTVINITNSTTPSRLNSIQSVLHHTTRNSWHLILICHLDWVHTPVSANASLCCKPKSDSPIFYLTTKWRLVRAPRFLCSWIVRRWWYRPKAVFIWMLCVVRFVSVYSVLLVAVYRSATISESYFVSYDFRGTSRPTAQAKIPINYTHFIQGK